MPMEAKTPSCPSASFTALTVPSRSEPTLIIASRQLPLRVYITFFTVTIELLHIQMTVGIDKGLGVGH